MLKFLCNTDFKAGYKEREDRIAELEEFINDQVTELDKMEAAMKQTVANKEIAEKELNVCYYWASNDSQFLKALDTSYANKLTLDSFLRFEPVYQLCNYHSAW